MFQIDRKSSSKSISSNTDFKKSSKHRYIGGLIGEKIGDLEFWERMSSAAIFSLIPRYYG